MKILRLLSILAAVALASCIHQSPGAKINLVITTNASLTPAGNPLVP